MATNYQQPGEVLDFVNGTGAAIASGSPVAFGRKKMAIALVAIAASAGSVGAVQMHGVFVLPKTTGQAAAQGLRAWWDPATSKVVIAAVTGAYFLGHFTESAESAATTCAVKLECFVEEGPRLLTLAATGNQALSAQDFYSGDLTVLAPNTAALTLALPAVANVPIGAQLRVKKTTSDAQAVTLDGNASETVGGSATYASMDASGDTALFVNTGTAWQLIDSTIA